MWRVIYSLNRFSISITKDTFEHLKTRKPKHGSCRDLSTIPGSHTWASPGSSSSTRHPVGGAASTTRCYPCKHWVPSSRTAFPLWLPTQHSATEPARRREAFTLVGATVQSLSLESLAHLWEIHVPHHTAQRQLPFCEKGPWSPAPPSQRSLRSSPKYNHSIFAWFNPERLSKHHILGKACLIPTIHNPGGVSIQQPGFFEEV